MTEHIEIIGTDGSVTRTQVSDPETARAFEDLPSEAPHIAKVIVYEPDE
ncbi:hypothetical protein IHE61_31140 [Streptomyces sp. GKU 257-1]|nr:hypothetical protein [Streptomyces sp. GKU 257-1]